MQLFSRLWNSSSQRDPPVKREQHSDSVDPQYENNVNDIEGIEKNRDVETHSQDAREGSQDAEERAVIVLKSIKKKKKRKSKDHAKKAEVEAKTQQLDDENSLEANEGQILEEPTINGQHMSEEEPISEGITNTKRLRKSISTTAVSRVAEPAVLSEESISHSVGSSVVAVEVMPKRTTVRYVKPRRSMEKESAEKESGPELETVADQEAEIDTENQSNPDLSELPRRIKKAKKEKARRITDWLSTDSREDSNESAPMSHQPLTTAHATRKSANETLEGSFAISPQQEDYQSDVASAVVNSVEEVAAQQPSKRALGKRKAVEEPIVQESNKKTKRRNDERPQRPGLRAMGFTPTVSDEFRSSQVQREASATLNQSDNSLRTLVRTLFQATQDSSPEPSPAPVTATASSKKSTKKSAKKSARKSNAATPPQNPKTLWNAINKPAETDEDSDPSLLVFYEEAEKSPGPLAVTPESSESRKRRLPVDGPGYSRFTAKDKPLRNPKTPNSRTPKRREPRSSDPNTPAVNQTRKRPANGGAMSKEQKAAICSAADSYKELTNMTDQQLIDIIQGDALSKAGKELWNAVCSEVPDIPRRSVQQTCRRNFHSFEGRGAWTATQDEDLRIAYEEHPDKWKLIGETLNRFPEDARDRWRNYLVCGDVQKLNQNWELEEENELRAAVKQYVDEICQLRGLDNDPNAPVDESLIEWQKVSKLMGQTRSRIQCRYKWNKLKDRGQVDDDDPGSRMPISESWRLENASLQARLFSPVEKLQLLRAIQNSKASREGKIPWTIIKDDLNGKGKRMAWKYCFRVLKSSVPGYQNMDFQDVVAHLVNAFEKSAPKDPTGFDIPVESFKPHHSTNANNARKTNKKKKKMAQSNGKPLNCDGDDNDGDKSRRRKNGQGPSSRPKRKTRSSARAESDAEVVDDRPIVKKKRKARDRMLKEGESQETTTTNGESAAVGVSQDAIESLQTLKRTPEKRAKRSIRDSKRNKALSAEKVVESQSSQEEAFVDDHASQASGDEMDIDHAETYTTTGGPDVDEENNNENPNSQREDPDEDLMITTHDFPGEVEDDNDGLNPDRTLITNGFPEYDDSDDFDANRTIIPNGFHDRESLDLDTPIKAEIKPSERLSWLIDRHGDTGSDDSSDDDDMSDIPARRRAKQMSIEL